ncbi:MAG: hypothetical protein JXA28_14965 [Bacteroidetes bacterium]|nr:hypothetical protein [Bacteroidota bacterium]
MRTTTMILLVFAIAATTSAQQPTHQFEEGKDYTYLIEQTGMQIQEMQGQTINVSSESTITLKLTLLEKLENGHQRMRLTIDNALVISENPEQTRTLGANAAGKSIDYEINLVGEVVDVDSSLRTMDEETQQILGGVISILPTFKAESVSENAEWTESELDTTRRGEGRILTETETQYTVKGRKEINGFDCFEIHITVESESDGKLVNGQQEMMITGTQEGKGSIAYDPEKRLVVKMELEINGDQTIMFPANNMRIPITSNQVVKVELLGN